MAVGPRGQGDTARGGCGGSGVALGAPQGPRAAPAPAPPACPGSHTPWDPPEPSPGPCSETEGTKKGIEICRSDNEPVNDINDTSRTSLNHPGPTI